MIGTDFLKQQSRDKPKFTHIASHAAGKPPESSTSTDNTAIPPQDIAFEPCISSSSSDHPILLEPSAGGRERAALATVFGVQEYTESTVFWERLAFTENKGTDSMNNEDRHNNCKFAKPAIQAPMLDDDARSENAPKIDNGLLSLPDIPTVSKFSDFLIEDEHGMELMFPANPSSVLLHSFPSPVAEGTAEDRSSILSSVSISQALPASNELLHESTSTSETTTTSNITSTISPPRLFIGYPPAIFDMLTSDDDERIIVWGQPPTSPVSSSHQKIACSSPSILSGDNDNKPSSLRGFSSNATLSSAPKRRSKLVSSARMSAQSIFADGLHKLGRQKSLPARRLQPLSKLSHHQSSSESRDAPTLVKRASFSLKRNSVSEMQGETLSAVQQEQTDEKVIVAASVEKLVEKLTSTLDYTLMTDFFLTYRAFISPIQLCKLLILRFRWALENDQESRKIVRIRTFVVMRHWLLNYFVHDFLPCRELRLTLISFLNTLSSNTTVCKSARDQRIVKGLKRIIKRLKLVHMSRPNDDIKFANDVPPRPQLLPSDCSTFSTAMDYAPIDDDDSNDSVLTPGDSEAVLHDAYMFNLSPCDIAADDIWEEEHAMAKLQYERRRKEEEDERQRAEFFSYSGDSVGEAPSSPSSPPPLTPTEEANLNSNSGTKRLPNHGTVKRPPLPSSFLSSTSSSIHSLLEEQNSSPKPFLENVTSKGGRQYVPATIIHDVTPEGQEHEKQIRRVPSKKWCKASPDESPVNMVKQQAAERSLPADVAGELGDVRDHPLPSQTIPVVGPDGLSRRLSRKSIEKRRSEKNLRELTGSDSAPASMVTTPRLTGMDSSTSSTSDIPPLPTAVTAATSDSAPVSRLSLQRKKSFPTFKSSNNSSSSQSSSPLKDTFEALPYDKTTAAPPPATTFSEPAKHTHKRRLSKKLAKLFKQQQQQQHQQETSAKQEPLPRQEMQLSSDSAKVEIAQEQAGGGLQGNILGHVVAELRTNPQDDFEAKRISVIQTGKTARARAKNGPIYLSHLASESMNFDSASCMYIQEDAAADESADDEDENNAQNDNKRLSRGLSIRSTNNAGRTLSLIVEPDRWALQAEQQTEEPEEDWRRSLPQVSAQIIMSSATGHQQSDHPPPNSVPALLHTTDCSTLQKKPGEKSFILKYRSSKLAQQFCIIEQHILCGVEWEELVDCRWRDGVAASGGVQRLIQRFNTVCQWVASEIVTAKDTSERIEIIRKFIRIAQKCKAYANFATLLQILLGLQSPAISRLQATWSQVGTADMRVLNQLFEFTSPMKNWKNMRDSMANVAEGHDEDDGKGCIPFLGIYLSDLVFNSELPAYIEPTRPKGACESLVLRQPLVNFHKHRITATVIKRVLAFQNLARRYPYVPDPQLYERCLHLETVDSETIRKMSLELEH